MSRLALPTPVLNDSFTAATPQQRATLGKDGSPGFRMASSVFKIVAVLPLLLCSSGHRHSLLMQIAVRRALSKAANAKPLPSTHCTDPANSHPKVSIYRRNHTTRTVSQPYARLTGLSVRQMITYEQLMGADLSLCCDLRFGICAATPVAQPFSKYGPMLQHSVPRPLDTWLHSFL